MSARPIKVALIDESTLWKSISQQIFYGYFFELPKFDSIENIEKEFNCNNYNNNNNNSNNNIKMVPEFIQYDQSLVAYNEIGCNPYNRPFLYLYVVDCKNDEIDVDTIEKINKWIENNIILSTTYLVILIQENKKMIGQVKPIGIEQITGSIDENKDIIIFTFKQKKPISEQTIENVRNSTKEHIIADCQKYAREIQKRLKHPSANAKLNARLSVWCNLLYFFYGFYESSLNGFTQNYDSILNAISMSSNPNGNNSNNSNNNSNTNLNSSSVSIDELLAAKIDKDQITMFPFTEQQEQINTIMFAFHGAMAVSYTKTDFENMVNLFFRHFAFIRERCLTDEEKNRQANKWGEESIETILSLGEIRSQPNVASRLLLRKFMLVEERDGSEVEEVYQTLRNLMSKDNNKSFAESLIALDARFLEWQKRKGKELIQFSAQGNIGWKSVTKSLEMKFFEADKNGDIAQAYSIGDQLLKDNAQYDNKAKIFAIISSYEKLHASEKPFKISFQMTCAGFEKVITAGSPVSLTLTIKTPDWLPKNFDTAHLRFKKLPQPGNMSCSTTGELGKPIVFNDLSFKTTGTWVLMKIGIKYKMLTLMWTFSNQMYSIVVEDHVNIPITVEFPKVFLPETPMKFNLNIDYTNVASNSFGHSLSFSDDSAEIQSQKGEATLSDGSSVEFSIDETGKLCYIPETFSPCLKAISVPIVFSIKNTESESTSLVIDSRLDKHLWQETFLQSFKFPLQFRGRLMTEKVLHIELQNICDLPLTISNDKIGVHTIEPSKHFYLMHQDQEQTLSLQVSDGRGKPITKTWNLNKDIMWPKLNAIFEKQDEYLTGCLIEVEIDLPKCSFKYIPNEDIIVVGQTEYSDFEGGKLKFKLIPVSVGILETPNILINNVLHIIHPRFIRVSSASSLSLGPFLELND